MNIFVTGATGVLGRPVVKLLVGAGHQVYALSRSAENNELLGKMGAEPVNANLMEVESLQKTLAATRANAILHLATKIPPTSRMGKVKSWEENNRLRRDGTRNLVDAALRSEVQTLVYPSFYFVYPDCDNNWIAADTTPVQPHVIQQATIDAEGEVARFTNNHRRGIALRLANLYGPGVPSALEQFHMAQKGFAAILGRGDAYLSYVWLEDAARAIVTALEEAPAGVYDIADDTPLTRDEFARTLAQSVGRRRLFRLPNWLMTMLSGAAAGMASRSQRLSNRRFKELTSWKPAVPAMQEGWRLIVNGENPAKAASLPVAEARKS